MHPSHLVTHHHTHMALTMCSVIQTILVFDGGPRTELDMQSRTGPLLGEPEGTVNKTKVLYGFPRDPDLLAALAEMEEEEQGAGLEDDKPKVDQSLWPPFCLFHL